MKSCVKKDNKINFKNIKEIKYKKLKVSIRKTLQIINELKKNSAKKKL